MDDRMEKMNGNESGHIGFLLLNAWWFKLTLEVIIIVVIQSHQL